MFRAWPSDPSLDADLRQIVFEICPSDWNAAVQGSRGIEAFLEGSVYRLQSSDDFGLAGNLESLCKSLCLTKSGFLGTLRRNFELKNWFFRTRNVISTKRASVRGTPQFQPTQICPRFEFLSGSLWDGLSPSGTLHRCVTWIHDSVQLISDMNH